MKLGFKRFIKRGQKGLTLVELMVVMAILAVLAAIVFPAVSGTSGVAGDSQVKQDASTVNTAVGDFFADATGAIVSRTNTTTVVPSGNTTGHNAVSNQITNSRYPEQHMTTGYDNVFTSANVSLITINTVDKSTGSAGTLTPVAFVGSRNALNLSTLLVGNYIPAIPKSSRDLSEPTGGSFNNYLWVVKKTTAASGDGSTVESRDVEIFKLTGVVENSTTNYELTYEQIY